MPDHLDQVTSAAPKNVEVAAVRVLPRTSWTWSARLAQPLRISEWPAANHTRVPGAKGEITGPAPPEPAARPRHRHGGQHADDGRPTARSRSRRQPPYRRLHRGQERRPVRTPQTPRRAR